MLMVWGHTLISKVLQNHNSIITPKQSIFKFPHLSEHFLSKNVVIQDSIKDDTLHFVFTSLVSFRLQQSVDIIFPFMSLTFLKSPG